jgi:alkanesulfonate monooxygenase SsuD/methylene tetrahydromethanopterin reductase-like flavin-dependent oxidoreductase (luciferase family)
VLEQHCRELGREPGTIERARQMIVVLAERPDEVPRKMRQAQERFALFGDMQQLAMRGTPEECIAQIEQVIALGVTYFVLFLSDLSIYPATRGVETLQRFADRVMPMFG